jgi:hypothetical protein
MPSYSTKEYLCLRAIHILAGAVVLLYWFSGVWTYCLWEGLTRAECSRVNTEINIFVGLIPMLFVVLSGLVILVQQRGYKLAGYVMIPLAVIPMCYIEYLLLWPIPYNWLFPVTVPILLAAALAPFYVLIKLAGHDSLFGHHERSDTET